VSSGRWLQRGLELRFWVAACVTGLALFSTRALALAPSPIVLSLVFCATLALYNLDGSLDAPARGQSPARRNAHLVLTAVSGLAAAALLFRLPVPAALFTATGFLAAAAYAVPVAYAGWRRGPPKTWPGVKAPFVGLAVAVAVVFVPYLSTGVSIGAPAGPALGSLGTTPDVPAPLASALWLTLALALACTANALLFDLPDLEEDRREGVPTVAHALGPRAAKRLAGALALASAALGGLGLASLSRGTRFGFVVLGVALLASSQRIRPGTSRVAVALWVDGALLLPAIAQRLVG